MRTLQISSVELSIVDKEESLKKIFDFLNSTDTNLVFTPNAGQLSSYRKSKELRSFLKSASLKLIDGWPLAVAASIVEGRKVSRVTGSDLLPEIFENLSDQIRVAIIGGSDSELIRSRLKDKYSNLNLVLVNDDLWDATATYVNKLENICQANQIELLILGLGHPKQEFLAGYLSQKNITSLSLILCFGASVDFLVGTQKRAPKILQKIGFEWFYRLIKNPKKFFKRYLLAIWPAIVLLISAVRLRFFRFN